MNVNELIKAPGTVRISALKSATDILREKGVVDIGLSYGAHLKMPASEAFKIAISPTTGAAETLILRFAIDSLLKKAGFGGLVNDFDQAIDQHLRIGLAAVPRVISEPPQPASDLAERVLKTLTTLEDADLTNGNEI
jgi:hypothetical protein